MLSQVEALEPKTLMLDATPTQITIPVTVTNGTVSFGEPSPSGEGVTISGTTVTTTPGSYALNFTLSGDTFSSTSNGITLSSLPTSGQPVTANTPEPNTTTTATVNVSNSLVAGDQPVQFSATLNLTKSGPKDPTIVNDPPQG